MFTRKSMLAAGLLLQLTTIASAAETQSPALAHVAAIQPPVWVERSGQRSALAAGAALQAGDRYHVGAKGRLHIALVDASIVKLGENAEFALPALGMTQSGNDAVLKGALKVIKGAFRFTTSALGKLKRRNLDVHIGPTVTAGIRGTDIWGKSDGSQDLICLLEGKIEVSSPGSAPVMMDQAKTFYVVPQGKSALPVTTVPDEKLATWAPQTELHAGTVALHQEGRWSVLLAQYPDRKRAAQRAAELDRLGYATEITARAVNTVPLHGLLVKGFSTQADALVFASRLQAETRFIRNPVVLPPA